MNQEVNNEQSIEQEADAYQEVDLNAVLESQSTASRLPFSSHSQVTIKNINAQGFPEIEYNNKITVANSLTPVSFGDIGKQCIVTMPNNHNTPVILGILWAPGDDQLVNSSSHKTIEADESLVLNCGKSSLMMEADGSVCLKGVTVTTQAYGSNRVKGAAVKIN